MTRDQSRLHRYGTGTSPDLSVLTDRERRAYVAIRINGSPKDRVSEALGVSRDHLGILLQRAEEKMGERPG